MQPITAMDKGVVFLVVVVPFLATAMAISLLWARAVQWPDLALLATLYALVAFGVTVGYHRMLTHRSFRPHPVVKCLLLILGSMAVEGPALQWAATHTKHHALADCPGDPHSPLEGFLHAHMGWMFGTGRGDPTVYCPHLVKDRMVVFISRTFLVWAVLGLAIPFALGGWTGLLWGGLVRLFLTHHVTWSVNSVCHTFGKRTFETRDRSHNEWVVGLLGFGEGWHNNHHAFPRSAFHGLQWWPVDLSAYFIWRLERLGLAREVHRVSPALVARRALHLTDTVLRTSLSADERARGSRGASKPYRGTAHMRPHPSMRAWPPWRSYERALSPAGGMSCVCSAPSSARLFV